MSILTLDLGKYKSVACTYNPQTQQADFETFATKPSTLTSLLDQKQPDLVIIEACNISSWIHDLCEDKAINLIVASTADEAWRWKNVKRKTDKDDALKLARPYTMGELTPVHIPDAPTRQHRRLTKYRKAVLSRFNQVKNNIRSLFDRQGIEIPTGHQAWTQKGLEIINSYRKPLAECDLSDLWRGELDLELQQFEIFKTQMAQLEQRLEELAKHHDAIKLLQTVPGIGRKSAEIIATLIDDPHRFATARNVSSYAGLVPKQYQSGTSDRMGEISRRGPSLLRSTLTEVAWIMLRYNSWAVEVFERICRKQKTRKKQAIVALARKILVRCWAMLRDGTPWNAQGKSKNNPPAPAQGAVAA